MAVMEILCGFCAKSVICIFKALKIFQKRTILDRLDEMEHWGVIGAFDKRTIIALSNDVVKEIAQKYESLQKGVGDIMGGALIETEARTILDQGFYV